MKTTRRAFLKHSAALAGGTVLFGPTKWPRLMSGPGPQSRVVSVAASDMLVETKYNPAAVGRAFDAGMKELTGEKTAAGAWSSLFSPDDIVGIKINCIGAPRISSSLASINATIAGLKSSGVKENNIIIWDRVDREFQRTGLAVNKGPAGVRVMGTSPGGESILPWVEGFDRNVYVSYEDGTLKKFRELIKQGFTKEGSHRDIFNSVTWLWTLCRQGNEKAKKYESEIGRLYMDYEDREGIKRIAEEVAHAFDDVTIEDEEKSFLANLVSRDITKLVNIAVLKHNEDSGVTWAAKNIALGVTTNKVRFHIDYCARAIPDILALPCLKNKMVLHIGEAAKISTVSVAGAQIAYDNRIFFSRDPVAMDRIGLDILEEKRKEQGLDSIRSISTHVAACAAKGLGTDDLSRIDLRALKV
ncbi:MAG: hypothetical protein A2Y69_00195 [Candidatus Aminicenantes bacterium RBG_13_59_9]|nr:MAG: hypothetical protein A2Y69_00195 [Candidatus Aminicenantes bacterium RBG_13_59_9]